jgi:hypothetical protein
MPRSPIIGTDSPVQYEPSESPGVRKRMPVAIGAAGPPQHADQAPQPDQAPPAKGELPKPGLAFLRRFKKDN